MDVCKPNNRGSPNNDRGGFFGFFSKTNDKTLRKQLVSNSQVEVTSRIVRRDANGQPILENAVGSDDYMDPDEQRRQQMEFIDAVQNPSFWQRRVQTIMQYYPSLSQRTASFMLIIMAIDPILQNAMIYYLINYMSLSYEEGGCCVSKPI